MSHSRRSQPGQLELFANLTEARKHKPAAPPVIAETNKPEQPAPKFEHLAEIAVEGPLPGTFTYIADAVWPQLQPGARVQVPFGRRMLSGFFIAERSELGGIDASKLKAIHRVLDGGTGALLTPRLLELAQWIARHYACPIGGTLSAMLPAGVKKGAVSARVRRVIPRRPVEELLQRAETLAQSKPKQAALLLALADNMQSPLPGAASDEEPAVSAASLLHEAEAPESALKALEKAGWIELREERPETPNADVDHGGAHSTDLILNPEQQAALDQIEAALRERDAPIPPAPETRRETTAGFLLQGVTGSGKTEVYLRALKTALTQGRQGLVLVPEIALTPQTAQRFERRLGREHVAVLHSHMTDGERAEAWRAVRAGKIDVVVGARSALFAPLPRLGLIVIDEEHENAFKQESTPRYHARDVALELARLSNAVVVLGSATPSFEALHLARTGKLVHLLLTRRVAGRPLPPVELVDMTRENREVERYSYLSRRLLRALNETLERREQAILFMNRRGFATVITCLHCGYTEKCEQCDITLTSHRLPGTEAKAPDPAQPRTGHAPHQPEVLSCHYCGASKAVPQFCSNCHAPNLKHWGLGTERVESEVRKAFPQARVARMDSDTMTRRTAYLEALGNFRAGRTDILIGTQMIAKGLDFPNVTLVGVVLADTALHMPDFRSRERTFQLLAQVAGRAGRSHKGGIVIVQTHLPGDPAVKAAAQHDFETFSLNELQERRAYGYPPYVRLARIVIRSKDQKVARQAAESVADALKRHALTETTPAALTVLGPAEAPLSKLEGYFRWHILLKAPASQTLSDFLLSAAAEVMARLKKAEAVVDVDPLAML